MLSKSREGSTNSGTNICDLGWKKNSPSLSLWSTKPSALQHYLRLSTEEKKCLKCTRKKTKLLLYFRLNHRTLRADQYVPSRDAINENRNAHTLDNRLLFRNLLHEKSKIQTRSETTRLSRPYASDRQDIVARILERSVVKLLQMKDKSEGYRM